MFVDRVDWWNIEVVSSLMKLTGTRIVMDLCVTAITWKRALRISGRREFGQGVLWRSNSRRIEHVSLYCVEGSRQVDIK